MDTDRRTTLAGFGAALMLAASSPAQAESSDPKGPPGAALAELSELLRKAPRLRDFKSVPMILENPDFWDSELLIEVLNYKGAYKQAWDNTQIAGSWLNGMRNSLNSQVFSFRHPDFLVVSATHGPAHLALYDQQMWDKYKLADLAGGTFKTNTLIERKHTSSDVSALPATPFRHFRKEASCSWLATTPSGRSAKSSWRRTSIPTRSRMKRWLPS